MKAAKQLVLFVFLAITSCDAQIETDDLDKEICEFLIPGTECYDFDKVEKCLKDVVPEDESQRIELQQQLEEVDWRRTSCPRLKTNECIKSETDKCMNTIREHDYNDNNQACNATVMSRARDCLLKFNATCTRSVVGKQLKEINEIDNRCRLGHYDECNTLNIQGCAEPVWADVKIVDYVNIEIEHNCKAATVKAAYKCLGNLRAKCPTQQEDIEIDYSMLKQICPEH